METQEAFPHEKILDGLAYCFPLSSIAIAALTCLFHLWDIPSLGLATNPSFHMTNPDQSRFSRAIVFSRSNESAVFFGCL